MADTNVDVNIDVTANSKQVESLVGSIEELGGIIGELGKKMLAVSQRADKMAQSISGVKSAQVEAAAKAAERLAVQTARAAEADKVAAAAAKQHADALARVAAAASRARNGAPAGVAWRSESAGYGTQSREQQALNAALETYNQKLKQKMRFSAMASAAASVAHRKELDELKKLADAQTEAQRKKNQSQVGGAFGAMVGGARQAQANAGAALGALRTNYDNLLQPQRNLVAQLQAEEAVTNRLTNARYAMFAAGASLIASSGAVLAGMVASTKAAMDYETALAQVERTSGMTGASLDTFADRLMGLSETIPLAFQDISAIATLGGQLGVPNAELEAFTRTVSQFGMTTNVTAEKSAEAFGRLDALLPDVQGNYDALGSAILNVGVNSVATESDIISVSTQIAAVGAQAGFSASEVIGFAAAMRSVGINPYLSRGGLTRIFGEISNAIANGGAQLEEFGALSGRSAEQFASDWKSQAGETFVDLLKGMEGARQGGEDLYQVMNRLNILNSQDRQVLAVLSQNYDELESAIGYASRGFEDGTQLQEAFGVQAETLASKLQMLQNSLHAMFAVLATPALAPLGLIVDGVTNLAKGISDLVKNSPALAGIIALLGGIASVLAVVGLGAGTFTLFIAAIIAARTAMRTVKTEMEIARLAIMEQNAAVAINTSTQMNNVRATTARVTAQKALIASLGGTAAVERAAAAGAAATAAANLSAANGVSAANTAAITGVSRWQAYRRVLFGAEISTNAFGRSMRGVMGLLGGPVGIAVMGAATAYTALDAAIRNAQHSTEEWHAVLKESPTAEEIFRFADAESLPGADDMFGLSPSTDFNFMEDIELLPILLERTAAISRNWWETWNTSANTAAQGLGDFTAQIDRIDTQLAQVDPETMRNVFQGMVEGGKLTEEAAANMLASMDEVRTATIKYAEEMGIAITNTEGAVDESRILGILMGDIGAAAEDAGIVGSQAMYYMADSMGDVSAEAQRVSDVIASEFSVANVVAGLGDAMRSLADGFVATGDSFNFLSASGSVNIANFQAVIDAAIVAAQAHGGSAADAVNAVFAALQANGINTLNILAAVRATGQTSIGGVALNQIRTGADAAAGATTNLGNTMRNLLRSSLERANAAATRTGRSLGSGRGGGSRSPRSLAAGANDAAAEVRTLVDYANDLNKVLSRAFDIRFGSQQAMDNVTSAWLKIAEGTKAAREEIESANQAISEVQATLAELQADRSVQTYFLSIAEAYGDVLRAEELRAKIGTIDTDVASENSKIAKANEDLARANERLGMSLTGDSETPLDNRETVLNVVNAYQDYLRALAASGKSQAELTSEAARLKSQFIDQATAAGFSREEIDKYAQSFDDMSQIISTVPYDVTVTANANPALQALAEFAAEAEKAASRAGRAAGNAFGSGLGGGIGSGIEGLDIEELIENLLGDQLPADPSTVWGAKLGVGPLTKHFNTATGRYQNRDQFGRWVNVPGVGILPEENIEDFEPAAAPAPVRKPVTFTAGGGDFNTDESGAPIYTSNNWWGNLGATGAGVLIQKWLEVFGGPKGGKVSAALEDAVGDERSWSRNGKAHATSYVKALQVKMSSAKVGLSAADNTSSWNATGSKAAGAFAGSLTSGFGSKGVGNALLNSSTGSVASWRGKGTSVGGAFAEAAKMAFTSKQLGTVFLAETGTNSDWDARGGKAGGAFAGGLRNGYVATSPAATLLAATANGNTWWGLGDAAGKNFGWGVASGYGSTSPSAKVSGALSGVNWHGMGYNAGSSFASGFASGFNAKVPTVIAPGSKERVSMATYATGGYTGGGSKYDIGGLVHKKEFVINAENTSRLGQPFLNALNSGQTPMMAAPAMMPDVIMVELAPYDRALLERAGNVQLNLDGRVVAQSTNAHNVGALRRGSN